MTVALLYDAIQTGLLFRPDMQVAGQSSNDRMLRWYSDRVAESLPRAGVVSLPLWLYRVLMLAWALWLATRLVGWSGWAWRSFSDGGVWRRLVLPTRKTPSAGVPAPTSSGPPPPPSSPSEAG